MEYRLILILLFINPTESLKLCSNISWSIDATTVAGSSDGTSGADSTTLNYPCDVYIFNDDSLYIVDTNNFRMQWWKPNATNGSTVLNPGFAFGTVYEMDVINQTEIYLLDAYSSGVTKWNSFGINGTIVAAGNGPGTDPNQLSYPYGMFIEKDSLTIWIADTYNHRIVKWTSPTESSIICGSQGSANDQFDTPMGIFIDENNGHAMYIADYNNHRIQRWIQGAVSGTTVAGETGVYGFDLAHLFYPKKVLVDEDENMFILDIGNSRVLRWKIGETSGELIAGGQGMGIEQSQLYFPQSLRFGHDGSLYIVDTMNNRIQKFESSCPITTTTTSTTTTTTTTTSTTITTTTSTTTSISNGIINVGSVFRFQILVLILLFES